MEILVSYQPSVDMRLLPASLLLHAVHSDSACVHLREPELVGQLLRAEAAGSMCAHQCALQHLCGGSACFPHRHQHSVCLVWVYLCYSPPPTPRKLVLLESSNHEQRREGPRTPGTLASLHGCSGFVRSHVLGRGAAALSCGFPLAMELNMATVLGTRGWGSSLRSSLKDFSLAL